MFIARRLVGLFLLTVPVSSCSTDIAPGGMVDTAAPSLGAVSPAIGPSLGGVVMNITGQNFKSGAMVSVDGVAATQVSVLSQTMLSAVLPAKPGGFGLVPVSVQNPSGMTASRSDLFAYYSSSIQFAEPLFFPVVGGPQQTSFGDFNGDQNLDMIVPDSASDDISVLLGDGKGGFGSATKYPTGHGAMGSAVGDLNRDGKLDIVVTNYLTDQVSAYLGDGTGRFGTAAVYNVSTGPVSLALVDLNGDNKLDIVASGAAGASVLLGDGTGKFGASRPFDPARQSSFSALGDFNGDGKVDLVLPENAGSSFDLLLGNGAGGFSSPTNYPVSRFPRGVVAADFNGDGKLDLAFALEYKIDILFGLGDGTFGAETMYATGSPNRIGKQALVAADLNGDHQIDLLVNDVGVTTTILLGDGKGRFPKPYFVSQLYSDPAISVADLNKDNKPDLIFSFDVRYRVSVQLNQSQ